MGGPPVGDGRAALFPRSRDQGSDLPLDTRSDSSSDRSLGSSCCLGCYPTRPADCSGRCSFRTPAHRAEQLPRRTQRSGEFACDLLRFLEDETLFVITVLVKRPVRTDVVKRTPKILMLKALSVDVTAVIQRDQLGFRRDGGPSYHSASTCGPPVSDGRAVPLLPRG